MPIHDYKTSVIICAKEKDKLSLPAGKSLTANRRRTQRFFYFEEIYTPLYHGNKLS